MRSRGWGGREASDDGGRGRCLRKIKFLPEARTTRNCRETEAGLTSVLQHGSERTLPPLPERALVPKAFGAQQREKSVCGNQVCWEDVGAGPEVPCKGWECCGSGEGKGVSKPEKNGMAWDGACVSSEWYLKAGFASCWVSTKRYCQVKDPEKGIYAKARGTCIFMQALEWRRIQHRIGTEVNRVQALIY